MVCGHCCRLSWEVLSLCGSVTGSRARSALAACGGIRSRENFPRYRATAPTAARTSASRCQALVDPNMTHCRAHHWGVVQKALCAPHRGCRCCAGGLRRRRFQGFSLPCNRSGFIGGLGLASDGGQLGVWLSRPCDVRHAPEKSDFAHVGWPTLLTDLRKLPALSDRTLRSSCRASRSPATSEPVR